jgi:membrane protein implicated in regulation of membrane protease activity
MSGWVIWAIVAVGLAIGEIFTPGLFFLGPVALAAVSAGIVAALHGGAVLQLIIFIAASLASLAFLRPLARAHLHLPAVLRTGTAALVGTKATVLQRVDATSGLVRIGGEQWTARPYMDGEVFEPGAQVEVAEIKGATALIYR